jgi:hypothetical protein
MRFAPAAGPLLLALLFLLGVAGGANQAQFQPAGQIATISAPRESLPPPVHDEATCAFCQAALFPPCAPQPTAISLDAQGLELHEQPAPDAQLPHFTSHRPASSRAPPALRTA